MGGIGSTMRWTPYGPVPERTDLVRRGRAKSDSWHGGGYHSAQGEENDDDDWHSTHNQDHLTTSGILMGINAPPLYDACLIGRWEEVLSICNPPASILTKTSSVGSSGDLAAGADTNETHDSDKGEANNEDEDNDGQTKTDESDASSALRVDVTATATSPSANHARFLLPPSQQTRYVDRRRNTPLHLACRRQPPPSVIHALLKHSPCEAVSRRTADGLTPLHFAAYCGAGVEVVGMLVDRMRSDAAVGRATRLSQCMETKDSDSGNRNIEDDLPPTRLLDRRQRTPLHCACAGFRTPSRPSIVRKLLAVDPASATLPDERGRTPFSLLFDDYAEEVMEALEEEVTPEMARERAENKNGGELYECWQMLKMLLQAAYRGNVPEEEEDNFVDSWRMSQQGLLAPSATESGGEEEKKDNCVLEKSLSLSSVPQRKSMTDHYRQSETKEVNVLDCNYEQRFSMVHAAAGVWECPPPLAKLVLKCICGINQNLSTGDITAVSSNSEEIDHSSDASNSSTGQQSMDDDDDSRDIIRRHDEETMRLPLHIAICARPQNRNAFSTRIKHWLSSCEMVYGLSSSPSIRRDLSVRSFNAGETPHENSSADNSQTRSGRSPTVERKAAQGRVYNPRFGRSPSRDAVLSSHGRNRVNSVDNGGANCHDSPSAWNISSNSSHVESTSTKPFLQHTMVRDVLSLYPPAASIIDDRTGKLPIVLAIEHGKSWETAVGPLLDAYPRPFGGGGDGGMALPDDGDDCLAHRKALRAALLTALCGIEASVTEEAIRTAGQLAKWGGVWGMPDGLDGILSEWLDIVAGGNCNNSISSTPETNSDKVRKQVSLLMGVTELLLNSRSGSVSENVAKNCLDLGREVLFSNDDHVREAAAQVLGAALDSVGDSDDAANIMKEVVLSPSRNADESPPSSSSVVRNHDEDSITIKNHGKLLACIFILVTKWGSNLMATKDISDAIIALLQQRVKDKNVIVRAAAYRAIGPVLGKSPTPTDPKSAAIMSTITLKEFRSAILKGTRATEHEDVQLSLAQGLSSASRMFPGIFLCKIGMPVMDAALMLAMMSSSTSKLHVQKAFQAFLWLALQVECGKDHETQDDNGGDGTENENYGPISSGLDRYIALAEGENGKIMTNFVSRTLAKMEDVGDQI